jgi:hypothetical protein
MPKPPQCSLENRKNLLQRSASLRAANPTSSSEGCGDNGVVSSNCLIQEKKKE